MADGGGMRGTTGPRSDGIGKALDPQYGIRSDMVRRGPTQPDFEVECDKAAKRPVPRDGNGNETFGWPF